MTNLLIGVDYYFGVKIIQEEGMDALLVAVCRELETNGIERSARGLKTIEVDDITSLVLENPKKAVVTLAPRRANPGTYLYLEREFKWYLSGDLHAESISKGHSLWREIQNPNGTINSNYGYLALVEVWNGKSQLEWCIDKLKEDRETRQAVINYSLPRHKYAGNRDFVCTVGQQFMVRNNRLESLVWMRANDVIRGLPNDAPWFTFLQRKVAANLGLGIGRYTHLVTSLHAYEQHFPMVEAIANTKITEDHKSVESKVCDAWNRFTEGSISSFYQLLIESGVVLPCIYFAAAIRVERDVDTNRRIVTHLQKYGRVLTEHVADADLSEEKGLDDFAIYRRDIKKMESGDVVVAEVSIPSSGVGYELRMAVESGKKVLCLHKVGTEVSAMIAGCTDITTCAYDTVDGALRIVDRFMEHGAV